MVRVYCHVENGPGKMSRSAMPGLALFRRGGRRRVAAPTSSRMPFQHLSITLHSGDAVARSRTTSPAPGKASASKRSAPKSPVSKTSKGWLKEHFDDPYVQRSWQDGYRSRASYKLL